MTDPARDTRAMWLRTKFTLGVVGVVGECTALLGGTAIGADPGAIIATATGIATITGITAYAQGKSDRGGS